MEKFRTMLRALRDHWAFLIKAEAFVFAFTGIAGMVAGAIQPAVSIHPFIFSPLETIVSVVTIIISFTAVGLLAPARRGTLIAWVALFSWIINTWEIWFLSLKDWLCGGGFTVACAFVGWILSEALLRLNHLAGRYVPAPDDSAPNLEQPHVIFSKYRSYTKMLITADFGLMAGMVTIFGFFKGTPYDLFKNFDALSDLVKWGVGLTILCLLADLLLLLGWRYVRTRPLRSRPFVRSAEAGLFLLLAIHAYPFYFGIRTLAAYASGFVHGHEERLAIDDLQHALYQVHLVKGSFPLDLDTLKQEAPDVSEAISTLKARKLSYDISPVRGYTLMLADRDGGFHTEDPETYLVRHAIPASTPPSSRASAQ